MCGIAGIMAYGSAAPPPAKAELIAIRDHMRARGPDGAGEWASQDSRTLLGHRRLAILDLDERANQPMVSAEGRFVVVFNGEIYNFPELKRALEADGAHFRTTSDTEALLHLYQRHGAEMVSRLRGMFAFAIYDTAEHRLFLARDPYGIKPLYYSDSGGVFRFASQVKALLAGGGVDPAPDPAGLAGFCLLGSPPEPFTFYRTIAALPAGATLTVERRGAGAPRPYLRVPQILRDRAAADGDALATLHEAVRESVRAHLLADVEVGVFLSAGVDSGALLGLMRDAGQGRIRAVTLGFEEFAGTPADEAPLAAQVARLYGAEHIVRRVSRAEFETDLPQLFAAMDQPSIDGVNTWFVAKAARELGLKVALSGLGGDELFAGYPSFRDIPRWVSMCAAPAAAPGLGRLVRRLGAALVPQAAARNPKALAMLEYGGTYPGAYLLRRGLYLPHDLPKLLGPEIAREGLARLDPLGLIGAAMTPDPGAALRRVCALESGLYMKNQLLRDADWAGMAHSLEIRTPLVDSWLLQAVAPVIDRLSGGAGKQALATAPGGPLPEEIVNRGKTGFAVPTRAWTAGAPGENDRLTSRGWALRVLEANGVELGGARASGKAGIRAS